MKDILVYAREFRDRTPACRYAASLAAAFGASMTGMYVCPSPLDVAFVCEAECVATLVEDARTQVRHALAATQPFIDWAAAQGVPNVEWLVVEGNPSDALVRAATRHDVMVLDHDADTRDGTWDLPGVILRAGIPCLVLPRHSGPYASITRVAVGWNGSPEVRGRMVEQRIRMLCASRGGRRRFRERHGISSPKRPRRAAS